jgi:tetratricopeptide (TPR) repeat protein
MTRTVYLITLLLAFAASGRPQDTRSPDPVGQAAELRNKQEFGPAIALLRSYVARHPSDAHAQFMLGETLYWIGDWSGAKVHFSEALRLDPAQAEARRQLEEIRQVTAPWIKLAASHRRDDQPLRQGAALIEGRVFLNPLQRLIFHAEPQLFGSTEHGLAFSADAGWRAYWPGPKLETEFGAGYLARQGNGASDWIGRASISVRLPQGVSLRARSERAPYLWTVASLETPVVTNKGQGIFSWDRKGWLAEAAYGAEFFPDGNKVWNAYGWLLAPLAQGHGAILQAGYSLSYTDSTESRWNLPADGGKGRYDPYYTPDQLRVHSVIFSGELPLTHALIFHAHGGYGFSAREIAPPSQLGLTPAPRTFHPWNTHVSLDIACARSLSLTLAEEHEQTAFWRMNRFSAGLTYRFLPSPLPPSVR